MNVLLLGSGGREHAMAWKLSQSSKLSKLYIAPGNPGTAMHGENVAINPNDFEALQKFCLTNAISMVVVGPEEPLVNGISDYFTAQPSLRNISVIGPCKEGAQLEGSKDFAKFFMTQFGIPTAKYKTFTGETIDEGYAFLEQLSAPYVIKADGLAAGKGVLIVSSLDEAKQLLRETLDGKFGKAGSKVVIEEFLSGIEVSVFVLTDGESYKLLPEAKDYKRIGEGDTGNNTGGMGAVSPVAFADDVFMNKVKTRIVEPTLSGLKQRGITYQGFIFIGLMSVNGEPYVIEYNVRMGDPETEAVLPRLDADLLDLYEGVATRSLASRRCAIKPQTAATVVCVSGGYPDSYQKGFAISGLGNAEADTTIFHAGTKTNNNTIETSGGRVLAVTSLGDGIEQSLEKTYNTINKIHYQGMYYRKDIGQDLLKLAK